MKKYQSIRITPTIMRNGSFLLLYSRVLKYAVLSNTPPYQSNKSNLVNCNIGKWDFHSIVFQGPENTPPRKKPLKVSQKATICSLELENTGNIWKKKIFEKLTKVLELPLQYCKMRLSFHCISECQNTTVLLRQLSIIQNH